MVDRPLVLRFSNEFPARKQFGERLRLRVIKKGASGERFCLLGDKITIGRDESCAITLDDANVSRVHAQLVWQKNGYKAKDLDSANGLLINGNRVMESMLEPGDILTVGEINLEVIVSGEESRLEVASRSRKLLAGVDSRQSSTFSNEKAELKKKKGIVFLGVFILLLIVFSSAEEVLTLTDLGIIDRANFEQGKKKKSKIPKSEAKEAIEEFIWKGGKGDKNDIGTKFYLEGRRELQNGNYKRAINAFDTAITIDSSHELAKIYKKLAKDRLEKEVESSYASAIRARKVYRYKEAKMHFNTVIRLLENDRENVMYEDSKEALEIIEKLEER